jgi:hypothetical protein
MKYGTAGSAIVKYLSLCVLRDPFVICLLPCETCAAQIKGRKKSSLPPPRFHLMVRGTLAGMSHKILRLAAVISFISSLIFLIKGS